MPTNVVDLWVPEYGGRSMKDALEAAAKLLDHHFAIHINEDALAVATLLVPLASLMFWLYLSIRRWRGDFRAVSSDLEATAQLISHDTTKKFDAVLRQFGEISDTIQGAIHTRIDTLEMHLRSTNSIDRSADADVEPEAQPEKQSPKTRLMMAESVRGKVLEVWMDGKTFRKSDDDPNIYVFAGTANSGSRYEIWLGSPYRKDLGSDGSLAYTLEVWADNYKKLNFEWDTDGNYALRGFRRGEWVEDLSEWHFGAQSSIAEAA